MLSQHLIQPTLAYVEELLEGRRVLLLGAHPGMAIPALAAKAAELVVLEPHPVRLRYLRSRFSFPGVQFHQGRLDNSGLLEGSFYAIVALNPPFTTATSRGLLNELSRLLEPEGFLYLQLPGGANLRQGLSRRARAQDPIALRQQLRHHFPSVELLEQQIGLSVSLGDDPQAVPTYRQHLDASGALDTHWIALCSRLLIVPEERVLTTLSLRPWVRELARHRARQAARHDWLTRRVAALETDLSRVSVGADLAGVEGRSGLRPGELPPGALLDDDLGALAQAVGGARAGAIADELVRWREDAARWQEESLRWQEESARQSRAAESWRVQVERLKEVLAQEQERGGQLEEHVTELTLSLEEAEGAIRQAEEQRVALQQRIRELKSGHPVEEARLEAQPDLEALKTRLQALEVQLEEARIEAQDSASARETLRTQSQQLEAKLASAQTQARQARDALAALETLQALHLELGEAQADQDAVAGLAAQAQAEARRMQDDLQRARAEAQRFQAEVEAMHRQTELSKAEAAQAGAELERWRAQLEDAQREAEEARASLEVAQEEAAQARQAWEERQTQVTAAKAQSVNLRESMVAFRPLESGPVPVLRPEVAGDDAFRALDVSGFVPEPMAMPAPGPDAGGLGTGLLSPDEQAELEALAAATRRVSRGLSSGQEARDARSPSQVPVETARPVVEGAPGRHPAARTAPAVASSPEGEPVPVDRASAGAPLLVESSAEGGAADVALSVSAPAIFGGEGDSTAAVPSGRAGSGLDRAWGRDEDERPSLQVEDPDGEELADGEAASWDLASELEPLAVERPASRGVSAPEGPLEALSPAVEAASGEGDLPTGDLDALASAPLESPVLERLSDNLDVVEEPLLPRRRRLVASAMAPFALDEGEEAALGGQNSASDDQAEQPLPELPRPSLEVQRALLEAWDSPPAGDLAGEASGDLEATGVVAAGAVGAQPSPLASPGTAEGAGASPTREGPAAASSLPVEKQAPDAVSTGSRVGGTSPVVQAEVSDVSGLSASGTAEPSPSGRAWEAGAVGSLEPAAAVLPSTDASAPVTAPTRAEAAPPPEAPAVSSVKGAGAEASGDLEGAPTGAGSALGTPPRANALSLPRLPRPGAENATGSRIDTRADAAAALTTLERLRERFVGSSSTLTGETRTPLLRGGSLVSYPATSERNSLANLPQTGELALLEALSEARLASLPSVTTVEEDEQEHELMDEPLERAIQSRYAAEEAAAARGEGPATPVFRRLWSILKR